jgi:hypothetical protein
MSPTEPVAAAAAQLRDRLRAAQHQQNVLAHEPTIKIPDVGHTVANAYEQLRNAAEYTEEHLLLQRASRRFYKRNVPLHSHHAVGNIGEEAVIELTQAGYLVNGTVHTGTVTSIQTLVTGYADVYWRLRDAHVSYEESAEWLLDILSVETENLLNPHDHTTAFGYFAYQHYLSLFADQPFLAREQKNEQYEISLYIAVHRALLKSDTATVRHDLLRMYAQSPDDLPGFIQFNRTITKLYNSDLTRTLQRAVNKYGAPMRILKSMVENRNDVPELLANREQFLEAYRKQTFVEYSSVSKRLKKGLKKSILFILITKVLIGVGIEVPYDLMTVGVVALLPLCVNLLTPPLYMASLKFSIGMPSGENAGALSDYIDRALFTSERPVHLPVRPFGKPVSDFAKLLYGVLFLVPFAVIIFVLMLLHFNGVQGIIFFVFISTASFLGFRLSQIVREMELVTKEANIIRSLRDFFYLPFILAGQWISSKYAKVNFVAMVLDMLIELPLKTVLRVIRQWTRFLNEKREQIY